MQLARAVKCASALAQARVGRRIPFVVGWRLLHRCNLRCQYCDIPAVPTSELTTGECISTLDGLAKIGTGFVNFTGGEVLLRQDLGMIIDHAAGVGISASINTNGYLLPKRIHALRRVSAVTLSLDGDERVHDAVRGEGSHQQVMEAFHAARAAGLKVAFTTVLSSSNLDSVPWLLDLARRESVRVTFQPARLEKLGTGVPDGVSPPAQKYRETIALLIREKSAGNDWISNSVEGLQHLAKFPGKQAISCYAGKISFTIEANGDVLACSDVARPERVFNVVRDGVERAFSQTLLTGCEECWCPSRVEMNLALDLRPGPILNIMRTRP